MKLSLTALLAVSASACLLLAGCTGDLLQLKSEDAQPADISVDSLLTRMAKANDPDHVFAGVKTYRMRQSIDSIDGREQTEYTSEIVYKAPDWVKQTSCRDGKPFKILIFKGSEIWEITPNKNRRTRIPAGTSHNMMRAFSDMSKPGNNYRAIFKTIDIDLIREPNTGRKFYRLICRIADENVAPYVFYVDKNNYLVDKIETVLYTDNGEYLYTGRSGQYEWRNGVRIPLQSLITVAGKTDQATTTAYEINVDIPDSEFEPSLPWNYTVK